MRDEPRNGEPAELLRAALSGGRGDGSGGVAGEEGALAAFREARDAGLHASLPTRDRDDWTPAAERRRPRRSLRAAVTALVASVTLGGVAVAAGALPGRFLGITPPSEPRPTRSTPEAARPGATAGGSDGAARTSALPGTIAPLRPEKDPSELHGRGHDALCRAAEKEQGKTKDKSTSKDKDKDKTKGRGAGGDKRTDKAMGEESLPAARQRLTAAAGGEELVPGHCRHDLHPVPVPTPLTEPRPDNGADHGDSSGHPGKGADRSHAGRS
ncbi:hypothetical protein ACIGW4_01085 [Streptomyces sp. NPDC053513]|uniref:hypothetical protein n=1 Tax=unclassified Streptomyces TaxID=2593676 RepID=UPI0037D15897